MSYDHLEQPLNRKLNLITANTGLRIALYDPNPNLPESNENVDVLLLPCQCDFERPTVESIASNEWNYDGNWDFEDYELDPEQLESVNCKFKLAAKLDDKMHFHLCLFWCLENRLDKPFETVEEFLKWGQEWELFRRWKWADNL